MKTNDIYRTAIENANEQTLIFVLIKQLASLQGTLCDDMFDFGNEKIADEIAYTKVCIEMLVKKLGIKNEVAECRKQYLEKIERLFCDG